ncbi:hypothetical protein [Candidatus Ichthyocystis sparus]|uniref:hypothetical protein n=1 Tax=Candidatus Ichthyocystis sparus TaxID=1561004 RepID=UPI001146AEE2|nr:hypothetical protein [Candidatus Ichthyocystis sparus]
MSGRISLSASGGSSSSSEADEPAGDGGDNSSLGAVGQDGRECRKLGDAGPGGSSSQEPRYLALGARPKKKSAKKEGGGSRGSTEGKGVVWVKRDRRAARLHRGRGQELAAERAAEVAARAAAKWKEKEKEVGVEGDGSGLTALRYEDTEQRGTHGRVGGRKKITLMSDIRHDFRRYGVGVSLFFLLLIGAFFLGPPILLIAFALSNILENSKDSGQKDGSVSASFRRKFDYLLLVLSVMYLLLVLKRIAMIPHNKNKALSQRDKSKRQKRR